MVERISTDKAYGPGRWLSQATKANGFIYLMGVGPRDATTGEIVGDNIEAQTHQVIANMQAILNAAGAGLKDIVRVTSLLTAVEDVDGYNEVWEQYFDDPQLWPARSTFIISGFRAPEMRVEFEVTAADPAYGRE